jgi:hypothetical protein
MHINDITYQINGAVFEVNRVLGAGFLEKVYENAFLVELRKRGLQVEAQLINYLKATGMKIGLLVNFRDTKAEIKRMVLNLPEGLDGS